MDEKELLKKAFEYGNVPINITQGRRIKYFIR